MKTFKEFQKQLHIMNVSADDIEKWYYNTLKENIKLKKENIKLKKELKYSNPNNNGGIFVGHIYI